VIAALADSVPAVQALGQAVFLPMIMIGGVGVPLHVLPSWAQHVAGYLPGEYAVRVLDACMRSSGSLYQERFALLALLVIGAAGCLAGAKMFRWDMGQKLSAQAKAWAVPALLSWVAVGLVAQFSGHLRIVRQTQTLATLVGGVNAPATGPTPATSALTLPAATRSAATVPATTVPATTTASTAPALPARWTDVTDAQINAITYDDLEPDDGTVTPIAASMDGLDDDTQKRLDDLRDKLTNWAPSNDTDPVQKVRALLSVAAVADVLEDPNESQIPLIIFERLKNENDKHKLEQILTYIIDYPDKGRVFTDLSDLGWETAVEEDMVRDRTAAYAKKLLARLLGKVKRADAP
jgi:ABC-2 type transport system permease protein